MGAENGEVIHRFLRRMSDHEGSTWYLKNDGLAKVLSPESECLPLIFKSVVVIIVSCCDALGSVVQDQAHHIAVNSDPPHAGRATAAKIMNRRRLEMS